MTSAMPVQCSNQLSYEVTQLRAGQFVGLMFSCERNVVSKITTHCGKHWSRDLLVQVAYSAFLHSKKCAKNLKCYLCAPRGSFSSRERQSQEFQNSTKTRSHEEKPSVVRVSGILGFTNQKSCFVKVMRGRGLHNYLSAPIPLDICANKLQMINGRDTPYKIQAPETLP